MQYAQQLEQLKMQQTNAQIAQGSSARYGLFGGPVEQAQRQQMGATPGQLKIPDLPAPQDTSQQEQIMAGSVSGAGSYSSQLYNASQQFLRMGDTQRAHMAYVAAMEASQQEAEEKRKSEEAMRNEAQAGNPGNPFTVGVSGTPTGRQQMRDVKDKYGRVIGQEAVGPSYEIGKNETNVNVGGLLTEQQTGAQVLDANKQIRSAADFINSSKQYLGDVAKGGVGGAAGSVVKGLSEAFDTAKYALRAFKPDANYFNETDTRFEDLSKKTGLAKATIIGMAYTLAASHSQDGRISDADFKYAMDELGGNTSSPEKARAVMLRAVANLRKRIDRLYDYPDSDAVRIGIEPNYKRFVGEYDKVFPADTFKDVESTLTDTGGVPELVKGEDGVWRVLKK